MTLLNRIRHYRVFRRMVLSYLLLIVLSVTIVSTILYSLFSAKAVKEIDNSSKQMLSHVSYTANVVYKQIQDLMNQLLVDNDIDAFMSSNEINKITNYKAYMIISKVKSVYPFITDISLYNFVNGEYIDAAGLPRDPLVAAPAQRQFLGFYPKQVQKEDTKLRLLTFRIVKEWQPETKAPKSALVIDLDEKYIQNTIGNINESIKNANTFVMDSSGTVLSHTDPRYFMEDFSREEYLQRILNSKENRDSFVQTINQKKYLITYVRSSALEWYFVTVRPYNELLSDIYVLRNWTLAVALFLIILGAAFSVLLTGNIYNPIRALVDRVIEKQGTVKEALLSSDEYTLLSQAFAKTSETAKLQEMILARSKQIMKRSTIISLLKGIDPSTLSQIEQDWREHLKGPYFAVILFKVDAFKSFKETYSVIDRELIHFAIGNISQELFGKDYDNDVAVMEDEVVVLLQTNHQGRNASIHLTLQEIQDTVQDYYKITVSISIGDWCNSFADLRKSYRKAQEYIAYRLFFGRNCIVDADRTIQGRGTAMRYPSSKERKMIEAVKLGNRKCIQAEIDDWIAFVSHCTYSQAMQYTNLLFLAILREFEVVTEWWEVDTNKLHADIYMIQKVETLEELRSLLAVYCSRVVTALEENKQNVSMLKNVKVIQEVKQLIDDRYADSNLSLEYAAAEVGLSAGYLGKLFKSHFYMTYLDYVTLVRLDRAKRLLSETNQTVAEIAANVGIHGVPYFSTLFKKNVGVSPTQYRDNQQ